MNTTEIALEFTRKFDQKPKVYYAPGRVNLIGEHTDYNQGFVMPMAIDLGTTIAISKRKDRIINTFSYNLSDSYQFSINEKIDANASSWTKYIYGLSQLLLKENDDLLGANIYIYSNLPMGAGLSSSASLSIALGYAYSDLYSLNINLINIAKIAQQIEHQYIGTQCGMMDQMICANALENYAMQLDCQNLSFKVIPFNLKEASLLICDTMVTHKLCDSEYNIRRQECQHACEYFDIESLRSLSIEDLVLAKKKLNDTLYKRAHHVVCENQRVQTASVAMINEDWEALGQLMYASHHSLQYDYEVSCDELNYLVDLANKIPGVYGARMTGGGFGGCAIYLIQDENLLKIKKEIVKNYQKEFKQKLNIYTSKPCSGVKRI